MYIQLIQQLERLELSKSLSTYLAFLVILCGVFIITFLVNWILKNYILRLVRKFVSRSSKTIWPLLEAHDVLPKLSQLGAALFLAIAIPIVGYDALSFTASFVHVIRALSFVYAILMLMLIFGRLLEAIRTYSTGVDFLSNKPIRSYLQIIKILAWALAGICAVSLLVDKSPLVFLASLGAISAVMILVFKDTILGFIASIQVSAYDTVRVGDWITISSKGVDGDVLDVSVNTVKVKNFDNTIVSIPTYDLITNGVQNWRGMTESGGRRIKRSLLIDIATIKFCDDTMLATLSKLQYLGAYLQERQQEIAAYNKENGVDKSMRANGRDLTNIGLFRAYVSAYLRGNNKIHDKMTFLIRQLEPTETGLPLQIYVFTNDTNWINYEGIQSDIFDHLLAIIPLFELRIFQFSTNSTDAYLQTSK